MSELSPPEAIATPSSLGNDERAYSWYYAMEVDAEHYYHAASRDDAIELGTIAAREDEAPSFCICEAKRQRLHDDIFDAAEVCESFEGHNEMAWGEDGPDGDISAEAKAELEQTLTAAFAAWRAKHQPWTAYMLDCFRNQEEITVPPRPPAPGATEE